MKQIFVIFMSNFLGGWGLQFLLLMHWVNTMVSSAGHKGTGVCSLVHLHLSSRMCGYLLHTRYGA